MGDNQHILHVFMLVQWNELILCREKYLKGQIEFIGGWYGNLWWKREYQEYNYKGSYYWINTVNLIFDVVFKNSIFFMSISIPVNITLLQIRSVNDQIIICWQSKSWNN